MSKREKVLFTVMILSFGGLAASEVYDNFYGLMFFAEPVSQNKTDFCKKIVSYKPFWRSRVYAFEMTEASDRLRYYYVDNQKLLKFSAEQCQKNVSNNAFY